MMHKKLSLPFLAVLTIVSFAFATVPTIFRAPAYIDWNLAGASGVTSPLAAPYLNSRGGTAMDTFVSAHGQFKDTWVLTRRLYDVILYTDSATKQVGIWVNPGGKMPYVTPKDSTGLFIPGKVDTIFTYRLDADTAAAAIYFAVGRPAIPEDIRDVR